MTKHPLIICLTAACLAAMPLAACAPAGVAPAPTTVSAPATTTLRAIDSREDGDATVNFKLGLKGAERRVLYAEGDIETLELALYWVNNGKAQPDLLRTEVLDRQDLDALSATPYLSFQKLKRDRQYRVIATAKRTINGTVTTINDEAQSQLNFSIGHTNPTVTINDDLQVILKDTPALDISADVALTGKAGAWSDPTLDGDFVENSIAAATLTFEGTRARLTWTSAHAGEADYDVTLTPTGDPAAIVAEAVGSDPELGTSHVRTFEMGTVPYGDYKATVTIKDRPGTTYFTTATYAQPITGATVSYEEGKAKVSWTTTSNAEADYDVELYNASDAIILSDVQYDTRKGFTSYFVKFDLASYPYANYSAKVRLKDRPATERVAAPAAFNNTVNGNPTLKFVGTDATVKWGSGLDRVTDYELEIINASDAVQLTEVVTARTGKSHEATFAVGSLGSGNYRARVRAKNAPVSAASTTTVAVPYTVAGAVPVVNGTIDLIILGHGAGASGAYYNLSFKSDTTTATTYTLKIYKGAFGQPTTTLHDTYDVSLTGTTNVYARYIHSTATKPLETGLNYRIEVLVGTTSLGFSDEAPYVSGADPIIGECTVNPPTCEFKAPPVPATIVP